VRDQENKRGKEKSGGKKERAVPQKRHELPKIYQGSTPDGEGRAGR